MYYRDIKLPWQHSRGAARMNNPVIMEFLEKWKAHAIAWALKTSEEYAKRMKEMYDELGRVSSKVEFGEKRRRSQKIRNELGINAVLAQIFDDYRYLQFQNKTAEFEKVITKFFEKDVQAKYKNFIKLIEKKAGEVTYANLRIGADGNINGYVEGDKGTARVTTIWAGGYNIQCLHFRILVK
jgi:hypothetical protein